MQAAEIADFALQDQILQDGGVAAARATRDPRPSATAVVLRPVFFALEGEEGDDGLDQAPDVDGLHDEGVVERRRHRAGVLLHRARREHDDSRLRMATAPEALSASCQPFMTGHFDVEQEQIRDSPFPPSPRHSHAVAGAQRRSKAKGASASMIIARWTESSSTMRIFRLPAPIGPSITVAVRTA